MFVQRAQPLPPPGRSGGATIMIGPGTGVAPFIGFLEDRRAHGHDGPNWLFFGEQRRATTTTTSVELDAFRATGCCSASTSRSQRPAVARCTCRTASGSTVRRSGWLEDGAHVYVCGDMQRMATDVDARSATSSPPTATSPPTPPTTTSADSSPSTATPATSTDEPPTDSSEHPGHEPVSSRRHLDGRPRFREIRERTSGRNRPGNTTPPDSACAAAVRLHDRNHRAPPRHRAGRHAGEARGDGRGGHGHAVSPDR